MNSSQSRQLLPALMLFSALALTAAALCLSFLPPFPPANAIYYVHCAALAAGLLLAAVRMCLRDGRAARILLCAGAGVLAVEQAITIATALKDIDISALLPVLCGALSIAAYALLVIGCFRHGRGLHIAATVLLSMAAVCHVVGICTIVVNLAERLLPLSMRGTRRLLIISLHNLTVSVAVIMQLIGFILYTVPRLSAPAKAPEQSVSEAAAVPECLPETAPVSESKPVPEPEPEPLPAPVTASAESFDAIRQALADLRDRRAAGTISEADYAAAREEILKKL